MRRLLLLLLLAAACTSPTRSDYVPGGADLPREAKDLYRRAIAHEYAHEYAAALDIYDELVSRHPLSLGFHLRRLRLARAVRGTEGAVALYQPPPPGVDPERAAVLVALARASEEDVAKRTAILESATAREKGNAFWWLALADVKLAAHDIVVRRAKNEQVLGKVDDSARSFAEAARIVEEARQDAETALQYDPALAEAHLLLGFLWTRKADLVPQREGRDEYRLAAQYHYQEAIRLDPGSLAARLNLAENFLYFGRYSDADDELHLALRLTSREPLVWNNLGYAAYATGRIDKAVTYYREALALEPANARVRAALADALRRLDREQEAVAELERARREAGDDRELQAEIAFKLGAIHEYARRYRLAVEEYQRHIDLGGRDAAKAKSRIRHIFDTAFED